jgi:segregation and condensation protein A
MAEYKVKFEVFEGPLDLLLYLIKKQEVDIYEVNLTQLATQFIEYVELMRQLDLEVAGEFLVMAATLMFIKSRELLPKDQQVQTEGEEETEDPRWELIRQLVEYRKFKDAAAQLQALETRQESTYPWRPSAPVFEADTAPRKAEVSLFDLLNAVNAILRRVESKEAPRDIFEDRWTVSEKIEILMRRIGERPTLRFSELFADATSRTEVVVTFLAVLELMRLRQIVAVQDADFGEIEISRALPAPGPGAVAPAGVADSPGTAPAAPLAAAQVQPHPS